MEHTAENDLLPFACCTHCGCRAERIGHDDTCQICQEPDGTPRVTSPVEPEE